MSGTVPGVVSSHAFLPWLRRGLASWISATKDGRATVGVSLDFGAGEPANVGLPLLGAQDVAGLDARVIIRTWPRADVFDAEPNYLALVELEQADLPWRYTPVAAQGDRLLPWLALVILAEGEFDLAPAAGEGAGRNPRPPVVTVHDAAHLPNLEESWAWAHAQVSGMERPTVDHVEALFEREPHRLRARLICPRRLAPRTTYTGLLVPAFRRGALAALGDAVGPAVGPLEPAWQCQPSAAVRLPVFFSWRFGTGSAGDFESLARSLVAVPELPPGVGTRGMDVQRPGLGLPPARPLPHPMGLEGALVPPGFTPTEWPEEERKGFQRELASRLATPARLLEGAGDSDSAVVAPPVYGRWHAALGPSGLADPLTAGVEPGGAPPWLAALNGDPRLRVAAGLGTLVVQTLQQELMAGAWAQFDQLRSINETLRFAQLSREGALRLYARQLVPASDRALFQLTAPVHSHLRAEEGAGKQTVHAQVAGSTIDGVLTPAWRRLTRPLGALGRRQGRATADAARQARLDGLLERLNDGSLAAARPPRTPPGVSTLLRVAVADEWPPAGRALMAAMLGSSDVSPGALFSRPPWEGGGAAGALFSRFPWKRGCIWQRGCVWGALVSLLSRKRGSASGAPVDAAMRGDVVDAMPGHPDFTPVEYAPGDVTTPGKEPQEPLPGKPAEGPDNEAAGAFREALRELVARRSELPPLAAPPRSVDIAGLRKAILTGLDPRETVAARFRRDLTIAPDVGWAPRDPLEPILAAPQFEQPMYKPLARLSQDWLLPGLEHVPANTVALLETNRRFLEAYMVGLSHELSRELVWNEFPTDQRGTYFRQFWDPSGAVAADGSTAPDPESLRDITPIHGWGGTELGQHRPGARAGGEHVVLLVRSELLRRYPGASVYAAYGSAAAGEGPNDRALHPVFHGVLPPDVAFYGFATSVDELLKVDGGRRWYLVLEEPAGEPRFGFDDTAEQPFAGTSPAPGRTAADVAVHLFQQPVRVLIPASRLLPPVRNLP